MVSRLVEAKPEEMRSHMRKGRYFKYKERRRN
jgi:hypothetical protein